jgi:hypothetical protein
VCPFRVHGDLGTLAVPGRALHQVMAELVSVGSFVASVEAAAESAASTPETVVHIGTARSGEENVWH